MKILKWSDGPDLFFKAYLLIADSDVFLDPYYSPEALRVRISRASSLGTKVNICSVAICDDGKAFALIGFVNINPDDPDREYIELIHNRQYQISGRAIVDLLRSIKDSMLQQDHSLLLRIRLQSSQIETEHQGMFKASKSMFLEAYREIDLTQSLESIHCGLTKSTKHLKNKALRVCDFSILLGTNKNDLALFESLRKLHREIVGRETRPKSVWMEQFELTQNGNAFAVLAHDKASGELLAGAYFAFNSFMTVYQFAARRESGGDFASRGIIWVAIKHAKTHGSSIFRMGLEIEMNRGTVTEKEKGVSAFKTVFGGTPNLYAVIQI